MATASASVTISQIQPARAIIPQNPAHLPEYLYHVRYVFIGRLLQTNLLVNADCATLATNVLVRCSTQQRRGIAYNRVWTRLIRRQVVTLRIAAFPLCRAVIP